jgi:hypothetical protein
MIANKTRTSAEVEVIRNRDFPMTADTPDMAYDVGSQAATHPGSGTKFRSRSDLMLLCNELNARGNYRVVKCKIHDRPHFGSSCQESESICETVDKVLNRASKQLSLEATYFNYESLKFLQPDGNILSDHNPITVNFTWSVSSTLSQSGF